MSNEEQIEQLEDRRSLLKSHMRGRGDSTSLEAEIAWIDSEISRLKAEL